VTGEYGLGRPGLESCLREKPDLRVVDPVLADINGIVVAREVRTALSDAKILVITGHPSERLPAMLLGQPVLEQLQASGQLVHPDESGVALKAVRLPVLGAAIAARELEQGLRKVAQESPDQRPHVLVTQALGEVSEFGSRVLRRHAPESPGRAAARKTKNRWRLRPAKAGQKPAIAPCFQHLA